MVRAASAANRFSMSVVSAFAGVAITLALAGLYGLLALMIGRRTREIAVRFALGARTADVARSLAQRTAGLAGAGVACGLTLSVALSSAFRGVLFGVAPNDLRTYLGVAVGFILVSLMVALVAIRRVVRIDPVRALQME
jgi:ABC-type antimicrobial peptide transport system permease subunit